MSFRIDVAAPLGRELRRLGLEEIDLAIAELKSISPRNRQGFHLARKRFKKLRGLARLARPHDRDFFRDVNRRLRDVARDIAASREASAVIETVDRLKAGFAQHDADGALDRIRARLLRRRRIELEREGGTRARVADAVAACRKLRRRFADFGLPRDLTGLTPGAIDGASNVVSRARRALADAARRGAREDFHELRKAAKYHWMHVCLLPEAWGADAARHRDAVKALGDILGELNDIGDLRELVRRRGGKLADEADTGFLIGLLDRREPVLRALALVRADSLLGRAADPLPIAEPGCRPAARRAVNA